MNKRFRFTPNKSVIIVAIIAILFMIAWLVYTAVMLASALSAETTDITIYIVSFVALFILLAMTVSIITLPAYVFKPDYLVFSVIAFSRRIDYSDMLLIRHDTKTHLVLLYFKTIAKDGEEKINGLSVCIKPDYISEFVTTARSKNDKIVYEDFDKEDSITNHNDKIA